MVSNVISKSVSVSGEYQPGPMRHAHLHEPGPPVLRRRLPGGGGSLGGPAKHCASDIHRVALAPVTARSVSAIFRVWQTTWQNAVASPAMCSSSLAVPHSHVAPDGAVRQT